MDNKYYTPAIEDIRIGYELEVEELEKPDNNPNDPNGKWWKKVIIDKAFEDDNIEFCGNSICGIWNRDVVYVRNTFRTPYLTKEQIENEGWEATVGKGFIVTLFRKNKHTLGYNWDRKTLKVASFEKNPHTIYNGKCPSINEFRTICKLLNI